MTVNAAGHTMVDFAPNNCGVSSGANLKAGDAIIVDIIAFVIALRTLKTDLLCNLMTNSLPGKYYVHTSMKPPLLKPSFSQTSG